MEKSGFRIEAIMRVFAKRHKEEERMGLWVASRRANKRLGQRILF